MEIVKVFNTGNLDGEDYENASGRRGRRVRRVRRSRKGGMRSGLGREGGRPSGRKRTGLNRAIGVVPIVAGARYLQRRRAEREDRERRESKSSPRKSRRSMSEEGMYQSRPRRSRRSISEEGMYQGRQSRPRMSNKSRPISYQTRPPRNIPTDTTNQIANNSPIITTDALQGKPNMMMPQPAPASNNNVKIALIVGGVLLLGVAAYFYSKRNK